MPGTRSPVTIGVGHLVTRDRGAAQQSRSLGSRRWSCFAPSAARSVLRLIGVPLNDNQYTAMPSFMFNLGGGALQASTLGRGPQTRRLRWRGRRVPKWNKAGGRVVAGLGGAWLSGGCF
jgi:GH24 family phage-related lysozyme (muramidase)